MGGQRHALAVLPPGKTRYPLYGMLGGLQGRSGRVRKIGPPPGLDPRIVQQVAIHYTDWAIPAHLGQGAHLKVTNDISFRVSKSSYLMILLWRWGHSTPPKRRCIITRLYAINTPENSMLPNHRWFLYRWVLLPSYSTWFFYCIESLDAPTYPVTSKMLRQTIRGTVCERVCIDL